MQHDFIGFVRKHHENAYDIIKNAKNDLINQQESTMLPKPTMEPPSPKKAVNLPNIKESPEKQEIKKSELNVKKNIKIEETEKIPARELSKSLIERKQTSEQAIARKSKEERKPAPKPETNVVVFFPDESQKGKEAIIRFIKKFLLIFIALSIASITLRASMLYISSYSSLFSLSILFTALDIAIPPKYCSKLVAAFIMKHLRSNDVCSFCFFY